MMTDRELVVRYLDSFAAGDVDGIEKLLAPRFRLFGPLLECDSREAYLSALRRDPPAPSRYLLRHLVGEVDEMAVFYSLKKPDGAALEVAQWFRCRYGLIEETRLIFDPTNVEG